MNSASDPSSDANTSMVSDPDNFLAFQAQNTLESVPIEESNAGSAARAATAAATSAAASVTGESASPNFTKIYGFFAALFDPVSISGADDLIESAELSALDWEIIKLLVRNLEVNVDSAVFRQQLADTYTQQQVRQQEQQQNQE